MSLKNFEYPNKTARAYNGMLESLRSGNLRVVNTYALKKHPGMLSMFITMASRQLDKLVVDREMYGYLKESIIGACEINHTLETKRAEIAHVDFVYLTYFDTVAKRYYHILEATHRELGDIIKGLTYGYVSRH